MNVLKDSFYDQKSGIIEKTTPQTYAIDIYDKHLD